MMPNNSLKDIVKTYTNAENLSLVNVVLDKAMRHSGKVFSQFLSKEVTLAISGINDFSDPFFQQENTALKVVISELKGDLKGKSYLILNDADYGILFKNCLPEQYINDSSMQEAMVLELDNILTAAVVTHLADHLKLNTYAFVPHLFSMSSSALFNNFEKDYREDSLLITTNTTFRIDNVILSPMFIWSLELKLVDLIVETFKK